MTYEEEELVAAASWVRDHAPGCIHADWWPPQQVEVVP